MRATTSRVRAKDQVVSRCLGLTLGMGFSKSRCACKFIPLGGKSNHVASRGRAEISLRAGQGATVIWPCTTRWVVNKQQPCSPLFFSSIAPPFVRLSTSLNSTPFNLDTLSTSSLRKCSRHNYSHITVRQAHRQQPRLQLPLANDDKLPSRADGGTKPSHPVAAARGLRLHLLLLNAPNAQPKRDQPQQLRRLTHSEHAWRGHERQRPPSLRLRRAYQPSGPGQVYRPGPRSMGGQD